MLVTPIKVAMSSDGELIYHVADIEALNSSKADVYTCESLQAEGFIHCCSKEQLPGVMERYYRGVTDLKLLVIDKSLLQAKLVYENTVGGDELFPHVYGPINMQAVVSIENIAGG